MNLTITASNGVSVTQPEQKWLVALLVAIAAKNPPLFAEVLRLVDNKVDAYATVPASVQRALTHG